MSWVNKTTIMLGFIILFGIHPLWADDRINYNDPRNFSTEPSGGVPVDSALANSQASPSLTETETKRILAFNELLKDLPDQEGADPIDPVIIAHKTDVALKELKANEQSLPNDFSFPDLFGSGDNKQSEKKDPEPDPLLTAGGTVFQNLGRNDVKKRSFDDWVKEDDSGMARLLDFIRKSGSANQEAEMDALKKAMGRDVKQIMVAKMKALNEPQRTFQPVDDKQKKPGQDFVVLDAVEFSREIKLIHALLNPPSRLHPWLKWLFYASRITPEMLELYYKALAKRDQIYLLAARSEGGLKIRYNNKIMDTPIFIWPDQAQGRYELVMVPKARAAIPTGGILTVQPQLKAANPSQ